MSWNLTSETTIADQFADGSEKFKEPVKLRTYKNERTGSECQTRLIYVDDEGSKWFAFVDLFTIPNIRIAFSRKIADLYAAGMTKQDLMKWIDKLKALARSKDVEKYEKIFALLLEMQTTIENVADHIKQHLALCTVYILAEDERIDYFSEPESIRKMNIWSGDIGAQAFFLNWHLDLINSSTKIFNLISQTASKVAEERSQAQQ